MLILRCSIFIIPILIQLIILYIVINRILSIQLLELFKTNYNPNSAEISSIR